MGRPVEVERGECAAHLQVKSEPLGRAVVAAAVGRAVDAAPAEKRVEGPVRRLREKVVRWQTVAARWPVLERRPRQEALGRA